MLCTAPIGLVSATDLKTGTATCNWAANLGTQDSASYTVGIVVGGYYTRNSSADGQCGHRRQAARHQLHRGWWQATQSDLGRPGTGRGGSEDQLRVQRQIQQVRHESAGEGAGNSILRNGGRTYQIKSNSITSLAATSATGTATFNGKANIQDITDPLNPISVNGNASLQLTLTGNGEPGTSDTIGITLWNKSGGLWFASAWNGTKTVEQVLSGGNLVIR